jgi:hypothetical protein
MTLRSNAEQAAVLSFGAPRGVRSHRVPTVDRCTDREHVVDEPSRPTYDGDRNLCQRCATRAASQSWIDRSLKVRGQVDPVEAVSGTVCATDVHALAGPDLE